MLRAYAKYLRQAGSTFSQEYIEQALARTSPIARLLVRLFEASFDPDRPTAEARRRSVGCAIDEVDRRELDDVASLDQDRILRSLPRR